MGGLTQGDVAGPVPPPPTPPRTQRALPHASSMLPCPPTPHPLPPHTPHPSHSLPPTCGALDGPWRHAVDPDAKGAPLQRQAAGHAVHCCLGRRGVRLVPGRGRGGKEGGGGERCVCGASEGGGGRGGGRGGACWGEGTGRTLKETGAAAAMLWCQVLEPAPRCACPPNSTNPPPPRTTGPWPPPRDKLILEPAGAAACAESSLTSCKRSRRPATGAVLGRGRRPSSSRTGGAAADGSSPNQDGACVRPGLSRGRLASGSGSAEGQVHVEV